MRRGSVRGLNFGRRRKKINVPLLKEIGTWVMEIAIVLVISFVFVYFMFLRYELFLFCIFYLHFVKLSQRTPFCTVYIFFFSFDSPCRIISCLYFLALKFHSLKR